MSPESGALPAQLAFDIIIGTFLAVSALIAGRGRRTPRRRTGRGNPADRTVGYDTMRIRPRTADPVNAGIGPDRADDKTTMELAA